MAQLAVVRAQVVPHAHPEAVLEGLRGDLRYGSLDDGRGQRRLVGAGRHHEQHQPPVQAAAGDHQIGPAPHLVRRLGLASAGLHLEPDLGPVGAH